MLHKSIKEKQITPFQLLVTFYFLAIFISFLLLRIPGVYKEGQEVSVLDSLFTAVSAISVTGLTVFDLSETLSDFGVIILMIIVQLGAIGVMSIGTFIWLLIGKKIGLRERQLIMIDFNQNQLAGVVRLLKEIIKILFVIEAVGAFILSVHFMRYFDSWSEAFKHGLFASITATTNSGFDITGQSFQPFYYDYFVQFIAMILIVLGAIGFPVLVEIKHYLGMKDPTFRFSLFTKITTVTYGVLFLVGTLVILLIESFNTLKGLPWYEKIFVSMFQSISTRSAGLTTIDVEMFNEATNLFLSFLMFVGSSPSSVGGGIRTTTFAIAMLFLINFANGRKEIQIFGREISMEDILRSFAVIILATLMVLIATMLLSITEPDATTAEIIFEVTSAFGTCGMSLGITESLSAAGKIVVMALMFIGRVGLLSFLYTLGGKAQKPKYRYPEERIIIG